MTPEERYERIDARLDAITMHLELATSMAQSNEERIGKPGKRIDELVTAAKQDGENIRALARIAERTSIA